MDKKLFKGDQDELLQIIKQIRTLTDRLDRMDVPFIAMTLNESEGTIEGSSNACKLADKLRGLGADPINSSLASGVCVLVMARHCLEGDAVAIPGEIADQPAVKKAVMDAYRHSAKFDEMPASAKEIVLCEGGDGDDLAASFKGFISPGSKEIN